MANLGDALQVANVLLEDEQDLIHKAVGWALREVGRQDQVRLLGFLDEHAAAMPRTMLRTAMEHLDQETREHYRSLRKTNAGGGTRGARA
jgi:3-methyladenine DNA glycosylase AlkD